MPYKDPAMRCSARRKWTDEQRKSGLCIACSSLSELAETGSGSRVWCQKHRLAHNGYKSKDARPPGGAGPHKASIGGSTPPRATTR